MIHQLEDRIRRLLDTQVQCVLATVSEGYPQQHLMAYAFEPSLETVYLVSRRRTEKVVNMVQWPAIALLWDNRTGNTLDHAAGTALMAQGQAEVLHGWVCARAAYLLRERSVELAPLLARDDAVVFACRIESYRHCRGYSDVSTYCPQAGQAVLAEAS